MRKKKGEGEMVTYNDPLMTDAAEGVGEGKRKGIEKKKTHM